MLAMGSRRTLRSFRRLHHRVPLVLDFARHCLQSGSEDLKLSSTSTRNKGICVSQVPHT